MEVKTLLTSMAFGEMLRSLKTQELTQIINAPQISENFKNSTELQMAYKLSLRDSFDIILKKPIKPRMFINFLVRPAYYKQQKNPAAYQLEETEWKVAEKKVLFFTDEINHSYINERHFLTFRVGFWTIRFTDEDVCSLLVDEKWIQIHTLEDLAYYTKGNILRTKNIVLE